MTHHTDAEQLHQLLELVLTELDRKAIPIAYMQEIDRKGKAFIEQAARRAPAAPVPQWVVDGVYSALAFAEEDSPQLSLGALRKLHERIAAAPHPPEVAPVPQFSRIAQKKLDYLLFVHWWQDAAAPQQLANHDIQEQST